MHARHQEPGWAPLAWRASERAPTLNPPRERSPTASPVGSRRLEQQLRDDLPTLSPKLQQVARYCLQQARSLHLCRILDVAEHCNTQPVTVVRLAKRYGFRGFLDFKMAFLAQAQAVAPPHRATAPNAMRHNAHLCSSPDPGLMLGPMKTILCFGDSNTHGTVPMQTADEVRRFGFSERWPGVLRSALGSDWCVIEEGLPGRTACFDDPDEGQDRNALRYWQACLQSHRPLDAIVIMLGTNDLKAKFDAGPEAIALGLGQLIDIARLNTPAGCAQPQILLLAPVPIREQGFFSPVFADGARKSLQLGAACARLAAQREVGFLDAAQHGTVSAVDGIHLDASVHQQLGAAVAAWLTAPARLRPRGTS